MPRQMGTQWAELLSGLAACIVGLLALGLVFFAPLTSYASNTCSSDGTCTQVQGHISLAQTLWAQPGGEWIAYSYLAGVIICLIIVALSAALHSRGGKMLWCVVLWVATVLLFGLMILGAPSIGLFLAPAWLLALGAACLSLSMPPLMPESL